MHVREHNHQAYRLDLSRGSYAVPVPAGATQLTPERWIDVIRTGGLGRIAGVGELLTSTVLEGELVGA